MFKLSVPTELEQRERTKGRLRSMQCARPSDRDAKVRGFYDCYYVISGVFPRAENARTSDVTPLTPRTPI